jgi:proliferating cell nuclear antigen
MEKMEAQKVDQKENANWSLSHLNAKEMRGLVEVLGGLLEEVNLRVSAEGLQVKEIDPSHVCLVEVVVPREDLSDLRVEKEGPVRVNVERLNRALSRCRGEEKVEFSIEGGRLRVGFPDSRRAFWVPLEEGNGVEPPDPRLSFTARVVVDPEEVRGALKDIEEGREWVNVRLVVEGKATYIAAKGDSWEYVKRLEVAAGEGNAKALYDPEYLRRITVPKMGPVTLEWADDHPLRVTYNIGRGWLRFVLAPKIEEEKGEDWSPPPVFSSSPGGGEG